MSAVGDTGEVSQKARSSTPEATETCRPQPAHLVTPRGLVAEVTAWPLPLSLKLQLQHFDLRFQRGGVHQTSRQETSVQARPVDDLLDRNLRRTRSEPEPIIAQTELPAEPVVVVRQEPDDVIHHRTQRAPLLTGKVLKSTAEPQRAGRNPRREVNDERVVVEPLEHESQHLRFPSCGRINHIGTSKCTKPT